MAVQQNTPEVWSRSLPWELALAYDGEPGIDYWRASFLVNHTAAVAWRDCWGLDHDLTVAGSAVKLYASSQSGTDNKPLEIDGIDANGDRQLGYVTLQGQTKTEVKLADGSDATWLFANAARLLGTTQNGGNIYVYEDDTVTAGVPQTPAKRKLFMLASDGVSSQLFFRVPNGKRALLVACEIDANNFVVPAIRVSVKQNQTSPYRVYYMPSNIGNTSGTPFPIPLVAEAGGVFLPEFLLNAVDSVTGTIHIVLRDG